MKHFGTEEICINNIFETLKNSVDNNIEFYDNGKRHIKHFKEIYNDVLIVLSNFENLGIKKGDRVGIIGTTSYKWIVIDLACIAKGIFTVPFDINFKYNLKDLLGEYNLTMIFSNIKQYIGDNNCVCDFETICAVNGSFRDFVPAKYDNDDFFTTIFTSGTEGKQKAIAVKSKCFTDQFSNAYNMFEINSKDKVLIFLPMHIYLERCYVYLCILIGFNAAVAPPEYALKAMKTSKISFTIGVPFFFEMLHDLFINEVNSNWFIKIRYLSFIFLKEITGGLMKNTAFNPFKKFLGGNARFFLTGSAPCKKKVLKLFYQMGVPLYEGYGMSEIAGMVSLNYPHNIKIGSVGKAFPNKEVKIDSLGQIIVRGNCAGDMTYIGSPVISLTNMLSEGWLGTGDVGHFDKEGYLYIDGRIKDLIVLSNGKKVHPNYIEDRINNFDFISNCVIFGNDKPYIIALIALKQGASLNRDMIDKVILKINTQLPNDEKIMKYTIISEAFTAQNGMLTTSFKLNRNFIARKFEKEIANLY